MAFFIAVVVVMLFARLCGSLMPRIRQPRVMGEVLAGILLGPTLFGALAPHLQSQIFASDIVPYIGVAANLGLIFYMFLIGLEVDLGQLRGRARMTLAVSNTALLVPLMLGLLVALPLYTLLAPDIRFAAFALFVGVSMSITAFPVLARIISERRMLKRPLGTLALSAAAVDDVSAWFLIALATAVAGAGSGLVVLETIGWAAVFCLVMAFVGAPGAGARGGRVRRGRARARHVDHGDLRRRAAVRDHHRDDRDRGDLRRVRDGARDAPPRGPQRRRHAAGGGLRR